MSFGPSTLSHSQIVRNLIDGCIYTKPAKRGQILHLISYTDGGQQFEIVARDPSAKLHFLSHNTIFAKPGDGPNADYFLWTMCP